MSGVSALSYIIPNVNRDNHDTERGTERQVASILAGRQPTHSTYPIVLGVLAARRHPRATSDGPDRPDDEPNSATRDVKDRRKIYPADKGRIYFAPDDADEDDAENWLFADLSTTIRQ